jgi:plastocyanin
MRMTWCIFAVALTASLLCVSAGPKATTVLIKNLTYLPDTVTIKPGETVTWVNNDDRDHTVHGPGFNSGNIKPGKTWSYTFPKAGEYPYGCAYHPRMRGTVSVKDDKPQP